MNPLANAGVAWLAAALLDLAAQPGWDYLRAWALTWPGRPGAWRAALCRAPHARWLAAGGWLVYCLGIPYAALLLGLADTRSLGLGGLVWWPRFPLGATVGLVGVGALAGLWGRLGLVSYRRAARRRILLQEWRALRVPWGWVPALLQALCLEASWAFARGGAVRALGLYPGVFAGLLATLTAWLARPSRRARLADAEARSSELLVAALMVLSALVFLYAENLWLCLAIHALGRLAATLAAGRAFARATL